ncbi:MAG TPA: hypothetical protein VI362_02125 [Ignavibacteriaceae bacterium]|nr:hypothetical protein [Ignavibacteriaceae bacterium]
MEEEKFRTEIIDNEHLKLLSLFHYIFGGIILAYAFFIILQFIFLFYFLETFLRNSSFNTFTSNNDFDPMIFKFILYIGIAFFIIMLIGGILEILSGKFIKARKNRTFSYIIAILNLLSIPYGSILGIMTLTVLGRNTIKEMYNKNNFRIESLPNI